MKLIILIFSLMATTCFQDNRIITGERVGEYKLGNIQPKSYDSNILDITIDNHKKISSIIVKSNIYKTVNGFGVGTELKIVKNFHKISEKKLELKKGSINIGAIGNSITIGNISFIDANENGIVDFVWIQNQKPQ